MLKYKKKIRQKKVILHLKYIGNAHIWHFINMTIFESERAYKLNYIDENIQFEIHLAESKLYLRDILNGPKKEKTKQKTHIHTLVFKTISKSRGLVSSF